MDEVKADRESLRSMANALRASTDQLAGAAKTMPAMPQVSTSAEKVGFTLSEITKTAAGLIASVNDAAAKIDASDGSYGQVDNTNADDLRRSGAGLEPGY